MTAVASKWQMSFENINGAKESPHTLYNVGYPDLMNAQHVQSVKISIGILWYQVSLIKSGSYFIWNVNNSNLQLSIFGPIKSAKMYAIICYGVNAGTKFLSHCKYRVIHKSVKHLKNSKQINYATGHDNSYANGEKNSSSIFQRKPARRAAVVCR
jgi:hypothetical protein